MSAPTSLRQLFDYLRRQPLDLRLEIILADLLDSGYAFDDFVLKPVGLFARRYRRDLGAVAEEHTTGRRSSPRLAIDVHREGLYDALPQEVFHHPTEPITGLDTRAMVADIRIQRRREKSTRLFFLPFEQEFFRHRVLLEQEERRYLANLSAHWYNQVLTRFWELHDQLPAAQVLHLLYLLPLAYRIVGDLRLTRLCFERVLERPVRLRTIAPLQHPVTVAPSSASPQQAAGGLTLGGVELGRTFVLGGLYQETLPALEVTLEDLTPADLELFFTDTWQARALQLLCRYFVAFETDTVLRYELQPAASAMFVLSDSGDTAILGYTTAHL
ncbi:type VI secretion system baseplate subunit TssG [Hymenobacter weizhouensis]|uniref:type VI secretion system baseplate subunit TssG n=1 Tax=Hymenobacter sp. YIM 151500-1 TaxID=2987689 RepID=UPI002227B41B|nr:type VI secretion system baseplate subunit TssG [Hymenobacter sp. YIM 151500-1]UYZ62600.1 type VI secretion system baseplate subunit TssG [Hymenobacter sp. YIM 151500-1]